MVRRGRPDMPGQQTPPLGLRIRVSTTSRPVRLVVAGSRGSPPVAPTTITFPTIRPYGAHWDLGGRDTLWDPGLSRYSKVSLSGARHGNFIHLSLLRTGRALAAPALWRSLGRLRLL